MAINLDAELEAFLKAVYGEDVRSNFVSAFRKIVAEINAIEKNGGSDLIFHGSNTTNIKADNGASIDNNVNNLNVNTIYGIEPYEGLKNYPSTRGGVIFTLSKVAKVYSTALQVLVDRDYKVWLRGYWGGAFESWHVLPDPATIAQLVSDVAALKDHTVPPSDIESAVNKYLAEHPIKPLDSEGLGEGYVVKSDGEGGYTWEAISEFLKAYVLQTGFSVYDRETTVVSQDDLLGEAFNKMFNYLMEHRGGGDSRNGTEILIGSDTYWNGDWIYGSGNTIEGALYNAFNYAMTHNNGGSTNYPSGRIVHISKELGTADYIQNIINTLCDLGGGAIKLDAGDYILDRALVIDGPVSLIGSGKKITVLHGKSDGEMRKVTARVHYEAQIEQEKTVESEESIVVLIGDKARHCTISGLTIDGGRWYIDSNDYKCRPADARRRGYGARFGLAIGAVEGGGTKFDIFTDDSQKVISWPQGNKNIVIRDVDITGCEIGFYHGFYAYGVYLNNLWAIGNGVGIISDGTDCTYEWIQVDDNAVMGAHFRGGNNRINLCKFLYNGRLANDSQYEYAWGKGTGQCIIDGQNNIVVGIECQDEWGLPFRVSGIGNNISGVMIDTSVSMIGGESPHAGMYAAVKFEKATDCVLDTVTFTNYKNVSNPYKCGIEFDAESADNYVAYKKVKHRYNVPFTTETIGAGGTVIEK